MTIKNLDNDVFRHDLHIELWDWLAKNPTKNKHEWPRWKNNKGNINFVQASCFACEFTILLCKDCKDCPFGDQSKTFGCLYGNYAEYSNAITKKDKIKYAKIIRDLPLREDWEWVDVVVKD